MLPKTFPHKHQARALQSKRRFVLMLTGVRGGKTITGSVWLGNKYAQFPKENHAIVCPSYKIMQQATLPTFFDIFPEYRKYYSSRNEKIQIPGCGAIFIRSADRPTSLEGMTLRSAWIDEAGDISRYAWLIMQPRVSTAMGQIFLTTRAYGINWLKKEFYDFWEKGDKDYDVIDFESRDNPGFPKEEWERVRRTYDPRAFAMIYQGRFSEMIGKVYEQFDERKHLVRSIPFKDITRVIGGIDWGYTQPAAIVVVGITKDATFYVMEEYYRAGQTLEQLGSKAKEFMEQLRVQSFFADPSEPMNIQTFREMRIPMNDANNKVSYGIDKVRKLLGNGKLYIKDTCYNLRDEFQTYQFPEEKGEMGLKEIPVKKNDHGLDALRYIIATSEQADTSVIAGVSTEKDAVRERLHIQDFINEPKHSHWLEK